MVERMEAFGDDRARKPSSRAVLRGDLDVYTLPQFRAALEALDGDTVTLEMTAVHNISAAFMTELVRLRRRLPHSRIDVVGLSATNRRLLALVNLDALCTFR